MRKALIILQIALISTLAILGALASAEDRPTCPLGQQPQAEHCES